MSTSIETFKNALSQFATGVTIVTIRYHTQVHGITVNAFSSVSINPLLIQVCIAKKSHSHQLISKAGIFAVNILAHNQKALAERFAGIGFNGKDRFINLTYNTAKTGCPILPQSIAWLDCKLWATYNGGDHSIFVGEVIQSDLPHISPPLMYHNRCWATIASTELQPI